ncbi:MAG: 5-(carboxyamino)imidazole ribonucleotide synthase [Bacteroidota bacterium]
MNSSSPILPPSTIGIIGGGQLGMMTIREAQRMGYRTIVWDPDPACPASRLADKTITAPYTDAKASAAMATKADVITYEFENINAATVTTLEQTKIVRPGSSILKISQHRRREKLELRRHGFPTAPFTFATNVPELESAITEIGLPVVVKTATSGYDGKGQSVLRTNSDVENFFGTLGSPGEYVVEKFVMLQCELSVIVARSLNGNAVSFPVAENEHRENILHVSIIPARISERLRKESEKLARSIADTLSVVGILCVEMFVTIEGALLVNELAPRPHNSGHYTLDACSISQFEALVRTVCGLPVAPPALLTSCAMVNILGKHMSRLDIPALLEIEGIKLHLYGKTIVQPKRKMGHVTILGTTPREVEQRMAKVHRLLEESMTLHSPINIEG